MLIGSFMGNQITVYIKFIQEAKSTKINDCLLPYDPPKLKKNILEFQAILNRKEKYNLKKKCHEYHLLTTDQSPLQKDAIYKNSMFKGLVKCINTIMITKDKENYILEGQE